jgi:general secretion pathway protein L
MLKLDTKITWDPGKFFRWWGAELAFLVPESVRRFLGGSRAKILVEKQGDAIVATHVSDEGSVSLGGFTPDEASVQRREALFAESEELGEAEIVLLLQPEQYLKRVLKFPAAAEENLSQVISFEMDRLTPFKADQVYFGVRVLERLPESRQIRVELILTPRQILDPLLDELISCGWRPHRVDVSRNGEGHDLLPEAFRPPRNRLPELLTWGSALLFVLFLAAVLTVPLVAQRAIIQDLQQELKAVGKTAGDVESLKAQAEKMLHENGFLLRKKAKEPAMADMLEELSKVMPDDTWLNGLQYRDRKLVVQGQSPAASSLIERIEASPFFKNVSFVSPVTKDIASGQERFQIASEVENGRSAEKPAQ